MIRLRVAAILLLSVLLLPVQCFASGKNFLGTSAAQFLKIGVGARAIAMGEAFSAVTDAADSIYWNPAGLDRVQKRSLSVSHSAYLNELFYDYAAFAGRVPNYGTFGVSVQYLGGSSIDEVDEFDKNTGTFNPYDMAVTVAWAPRFKDSQEYFAFGVAGKFIQTKITETAIAGAVDLGVQWNPLKQLWLGGAVQNIGNPMKYKSDSDPLPLNFKAGAAYKFIDAVTVSYDVNLPRDNQLYVTAGVEGKYAAFKDMDFTLRGGYNNKVAADFNSLAAVSAGAGLRFGRYDLDFSWTPFGELGTDYRASLAVRF